MSGGIVLAIFFDCETKLCADADSDARDPLRPEKGVGRQT
jgi:hypothetical protein